MRRGCCGQAPFGTTQHNSASGSNPSGNPPNGSSPGSEVVTMHEIVMVVEDDRSIRHLLGAVLRANGLEPVLVPDAETALERLPSEQPDVILCDVKLPGMNGDQLCQIVKSGKLASTALVLMSAYDEPNHHAADAFIAKPFEPSEVVDLIESIKSHR